jgi:hypothetical protein
MHPVASYVERPDNGVEGQSIPFVIGKVKVGAILFK